jgi:hypothetical protein
VHSCHRPRAERRADLEVAEVDGLEPGQAIALEVIRGPDGEPGAGVPTVLQSTCIQADRPARQKGSADDRADERVL